MSEPGLYIVTLNNAHPISVNANDPRIADRCIFVTRDNCKFGKAKSLASREQSYFKVFGAGNVNFRRIALTEDIATAERLVLKQLLPWRIRGKTGRRNEWLAGISAPEVERIALAVLAEAGITFSRCHPCNAFGPERNATP